MQFFKSSEYIDVIFENDIDIESGKTGQVKHFVAGEQTITREEYEEFKLKRYRKVNLCFNLDGYFKNQEGNLVKIDSNKEHSLSLKSIQAKKWPWKFLATKCI